MLTTSAPTLYWENPTPGWPLTLTSAAQKVDRHVQTDLSSHTGRRAPLTSILLACSWTPVTKVSLLPPQMDLYLHTQPEEVEQMFKPCLNIVFVTNSHLAFSLIFTPSVCKARLYLLSSLD